MDSVSAHFLLECRVDCPVASDMTRSVHDTAAWNTAAWNTAAWNTAAWNTAAWNTGAWNDEHGLSPRRRGRRPKHLATLALVTVCLVSACGAEESDAAAGDEVPVAVPAAGDSASSNASPDRANSHDQTKPGSAVPDPSAEGNDERAARQQAQQKAADARSAKRANKRDERRAKTKATRDKRVADRKAKKKAKRQNKEKSKEPRRARSAASFVLSENPPAPPTGILVRVHRRHIISGIIQVHDEYHASSLMAERRNQALRAAGWRPWPPSPRPDLAKIVARTRAEFRECPFLLEVSHMPKNWLQGAGKFVSCQGSVKDLEAALGREYAIAFHQASAEPCRDLVNLPLSDLQTPAMTPLRKRCENMGVDLRPKPQQTAADKSRTKHRDASPL
ncbi:MAG: hypothetical protein ACI9OJ_001071 [Myxococcota bacterium]|jgi:hypothetical protein